MQASKIPSDWFLKDTFFVEIPSYYLLRDPKTLEPDPPKKNRRMDRETFQELALTTAGIVDAMSALPNRVAMKTLMARTQELIDILAEAKEGMS